jgi:PPP family 3-phenylpropionic acid transporter
MSLPLPLSFRLASFYFAYFAYAGAFVAYLPLYLAWRGLQAGEIAFLLALPLIARMFAPAAWGWLADRSGAQRGIVAFSCAANAACFAALPYAGGVRDIAWLLGAMSVLSAGAVPLVEAITLGLLAGRAGRYGPIRLWGSLGFIAAVLGGGAWLDFQPVRGVPHALAALSLAALAVSVALPAGSVHAEPQPSSLCLTPAMRTLLAAGFCMAAAHGTLYAFFTLHLEGAGYSGTLIGTLWTLGVLAEIVVFLYLPALFRRHTLSAILVASFLCAVVRFIAIGWGAAELWILVAAQLLHAATFGAFHAASVAAVHRVFPQAAQARGQTLFSSLSYGAGGAAGALLAGWAWQASGPGLAFTVSALAALAGAYFAYRLKRAGL